MGHRLAGSSRNREVTTQNGGTARVLVGVASSFPKGYYWLMRNGLIDITEVAVGLAVEGLGGPQLRTCVHLTGWVCEVLYMSSVGRGRWDAEPVCLALFEVRSEVSFE